MGAIKEKQLSSVFFFFLPLAFFLLQALFPFYWMVTSSVKAPAEFYAYRQSLFPTQPVLKHYIELFTETPFLMWMRNSVIVGISTAFFSVLIGGAAGYALARLKFWQKFTIGRVIFVTYLVPPALLFIPLFTILATLHVENSLFSLIVTYPTFAAPFCAWLMTGYLKTIPKEIEECAMIDGATRLQILARIVLPLAIPGILCAATFTFTLCWNEYLYALVFIFSSSQQTIPVGIPALFQGDLIQWGKVMAASVVGSVPVVVVYSFLLRFFVAGLATGAVKG